MKEIVRIIYRPNGSIILTSLRKKHFDDREISVDFSNINYGLERVLSSSIEEATNNPNKHKLIAWTQESFPAVTINDSDKEELKVAIDQRLNYAEIECNDDGYPILNNERRLVIYAYYSDLPNIILSPTDALERIKQFNEKYTNNHKLTPGLHESS